MGFRSNRLKLQWFSVTIHTPSRRSIQLHTDAAGAPPKDAFGPFRVLHQIGAGALGPVFRAYDPERDRLVAVKLFRLDLPPERVHRLVAQFERLIAAGLTHPAIAAPLATGIEEVTAYLAQDYVAGESLDATVRGHGPAPPSDALRVVTQLAGALDFASVVRVNHGVLHPRDILQCGEETRLTGLGIARALESIGVPTPVRRPYTAPERVVGSPWDRRADVFGLAALIHELLWARRVAATGEETAASLTEIAGGDLARLRTVFGRALAEDPARRFDTALEFAEALRDAFPDVVISTRASRLPTVDERLPIESEPQLPLEVPRDELEAAPRVAPGEFDFRRAESTRYADVESAPSPGEQPAVPFWADQLPGHDPPGSVPAVPAGLVDSYQPAADVPLTAERSKSAISALALALVVGGVVGFAAGYGVGTRDRSAAPSFAVSSSTSNPGTPAGTTGAAPELTETTVKSEPDVRLRPDATPERPSPVDADPGVRTLPDRSDRRGLGGNSQRDQSGSLLVRSAPLGARVFVDGREYGRTPVTVRDLARGAHRVRVIHDGYTIEDRRVAITASQSTRAMTVWLSPARIPTATTRQPAEASPLTPATTGQYAAPLLVESRPDGAKVFIDARLVGTTPLALAEVALGEHALRLERDGYRRWSSSIRVVAGEQNRVTASLER